MNIDPAVLATLETEAAFHRKCRTTNYQALWSLRQWYNDEKAQNEADCAVADARVEAYKAGKPLPSYYIV